MCPSALFLTTYYIFSPVFLLFVFFFAKGIQNKPWICITEAILQKRIAIFFDLKGDKKVIPL